MPGQAIIRFMTVATAAFTLSATALLASSALAHEQWSDGGPIPAWVKRQCCGLGDAHHLRASQVRVTPSGYRVEGCQDTIPEDRLMRSPDGEWWVFYHDYESGDQSLVYCFFGPSQGS